MAPRTKTVDVDGVDDRSAEWEAWVATTPCTRKFEPGEFRALFEGAGPATHDDVPWEFPVRTPLRRDEPV